MSLLYTYCGNFEFSFRPNRAEFPKQNPNRNRTRTRIQIKTRTNSGSRKFKILGLLWKFRISGRFLPNRTRIEPESETWTEPEANPKWTEPEPEIFIFLNFFLFEIFCFIFISKKKNSKSSASGSGHAAISEFPQYYFVVKDFWKFSAYSVILGL